MGSATNLRMCVDMAKNSRKSMLDRFPWLVPWLGIFFLLLLTVAMLLYRLVTWPFPKPKRKGWLEDFDKSLKDPYGTTKRGALPDLDATPDNPIPFGHEQKWLAIRAENHNDVVGSLPIDNAQATNWRTGLEAVNRGYTYITPVVDGWVLVVSQDLPTPIESGENPLVQYLAKQFAEIQFFAAHEEHDDFFVWSRFRHGVEERTLVYSLESAAGVACERGELSTEEFQLGLTSFDYEKRPESGDVQRLASMWSIAPQSLGELGGTKGTGTVGLIRIPVSTNE